MSCDFAGRYPSRRLSNDEAGALYEQLCESVVDGLQPHPTNASC